MTDVIGDFLTRIKNAVERAKPEIVVKHSNMLGELSKILKAEGFIEDFQVVEDKPQNKLVVTLRYVNGESVVRDLGRISRPGRRVYNTVDTVQKRFKNGLGFTIYSTSKGLMTGKDAVKHKLGGECICYVY